MKTHPAPQQVRPRAAPARSRQLPQRLPAADGGHRTAGGGLHVHRLAGPQPELAGQRRDAARIEELAQSLNYSINVGASNLRLQRNRTVAVVVPLRCPRASTSPIPSSCSMLGRPGRCAHRPRLRHAALARRCRTARSRRRHRRLGARHRRDPDRAVASPRSAQRTRGAALPPRRLGRTLPQQIYCTIGGDNIAGGMLATEHLIGLRARRIAFFGDIDLPEVGHRFEGYRRPSQSTDRPFDVRLVRRTRFRRGQRSGRPSSNIGRSDGCASTPFSPAAICWPWAHWARCANTGCACPQDVGVVGYDDSNSPAFHPSADARSVSPSSRAPRRWSMRCSRSLQGERPSPPLLPAELIVRESSAPGPGRSR